MLIQWYWLKHRNFYHFMCNCTSGLFLKFGYIQSNNITDKYSALVFLYMYIHIATHYIVDKSLLHVICMCICTCACLKICSYVTCRFLLWSLRNEWWILRWQLFIWHPCTFIDRSSTKHYAHSFIQCTMFITTPST